MKWLGILDCFLILVILNAQSVDVISITNYFDLIKSTGFCAWFVQIQKRLRIMGHFEKGENEAMRK